MTRAEICKCKKLMHEAISLGKQAQEEYKLAACHLQKQNSLEWEIEHNKASQHYGEAIGINQVLVTLGFKDEHMKELSELL